MHGGARSFSRSAFEIRSNNWEVREYDWGIPQLLVKTLMLSSYQADIDGESLWAEAANDS